MNERIKDLLRQSGGILKDEDGTELPTYVLVGNGPEKFAELIVRECLSYAKDGDLDFMKFMIKQHFGVEE